DLKTYVSGHADSIINYAAARRSAKPISTATTESTVQPLIHRRMTAKQQMRWSPRGAHLMLKVRTAVMNAIRGAHAAAELVQKRRVRAEIGRGLDVAFEKAPAPVSLR